MQRTLANIDLKNLTCPITQEIFLQPVATTCGHVFEKEALEIHLATQNFCPLCRKQPITCTGEVSVIKAIINSIIQNFPGLLEEQYFSENILKDLIQNGREIDANMLLQINHRKLNLLVGTTYFKCADREYFLGNFETALALYTQAIKWDSATAKFFGNRGETRTHLKDFSNAIIDFTQAITLSPIYPHAFFNRAIAEAAVGKYEEAMADLEVAIAQKPDYALAYRERALVKISKLDYAGALKDFAICLELDPTSVSTYEKSASLKSLQGDWLGAINDYDKAIALDPTIASYYFNRGIAKKMQGAYREALADYDAAARLSPPNADHLYKRAIVNYLLNNYVQSIRDCQQAMAAEPDRLDANKFHLRGKCKMHLKIWQGSIDDYNEAIRLNKNLHDVYNDRGVAKYQKGMAENRNEDLESARADFDQVLALYPNNHEVIYYRGLVNFLLKNYPAAHVDLTQAIQIAPQHSHYYQLRARLRLALNDDAGALSDFNVVVDSAPDNLDVCQERMPVLIKLNKSNPGILGELVAKLPPRRQAALARLYDHLNRTISADAWYKLGMSNASNPAKAVEAMANFNKALSCYSEHALARIESAKLHYQFNNIASALKNAEYAHALVDISDEQKAWLADFISKLKTTTSEKNSDKRKAEPIPRLPAESINALHREGVFAEPASKRLKPEPKDKPSL